MQDASTPALIVEQNIDEFFSDLVVDAASHQQVDAADQTLDYLTELLSSFLFSRNLYDKTPDGQMIRPLTSLYGEAIAAPTSLERDRTMKRLGDIALFVAGIFSDSLNRKQVDIDYYIAMGGSAYGSIGGGHIQHRAASVFGELAAKFTSFVDVLNEVSERAKFNNDQDILRLYEMWIRTGSKRAAKRLRVHGIEPINAADSRKRH